MPRIPFCKFHGFGNDYIVIEATNVPEETDLAELSRAICDRHTGAGSDGIAVLTRMDGGEADFHCEIVNPDGSYAGFSGNGTRCAVAYLYFKELWQSPELRLQMRTGVKTFRMIGSDPRGHYRFEAEIGKPAFRSDLVPVATREPAESVVDHPVTVLKRTFLVSGVNVGNPVACIFVNEFDTEWRTYGRELETHAAFPEKANIVFVKVLDRENIEIRIWERAAGETSASGTCASGAAVLSAFTGRTERNVAVRSPGGTSKIQWRDDDEILITGSADLAYCGEWPI